MFDNINLSSLALGGVVAAAVAFWGQARSFLSYVSSFLIVSADVDYQMSPIVVNYLKANAIRLPSGILNYRGVVLQTKTSGPRLVPFRAITKTSVFIVRKTPIVVTISETLRFTTFRGFDSDAFIRTCLEWQFKFVNPLETDTLRDRFYVHKVMGYEKVAGVISKNHSSSGELSSDRPSDSVNSVLTNVSAGIDKSFMFGPEDLITANCSKPLDGLFYDPETLQHLEDAKQWLANESWYRDRSIPWRRGWLIYGPGGTGKSSLARATARTLRVPLMHFYLNTMSDQEFVREWEQLPLPCVVLFEDFDTVFDGRIPLTEHKSLSFDTVINAISGVHPVNGVFLVVTSNNIDKIDPAMGITSKDGSLSTRPGRLDRAIYLGAASQNVREQVVNHILRDWPELHTRLVEKSAGMTVVQVQELCVQLALNKRAKPDLNFNVLLDNISSINHGNSSDQPFTDSQDYDSGSVRHERGESSDAGSGRTSTSVRRVGETLSSMVCG